MTLGDFVAGSVVVLADGRTMRLAWSTVPFDKRKDTKTPIDGWFVGTLHSSPTWLPCSTAVVEVLEQPELIASARRPEGPGAADVDPLRDAARLGPLFAEAPSSAESIDNDDGGPR